MKRITIKTLILIGAISFSCSKMDDMHKEFIGDGPIKYMGKIHPIAAFSGKDRVLLVGQKPSDPDAETVKVFWQFEGQRDSIERKLSEIVDPSTSEIKLFIEGLNEGYYTFQIITYDASGNHSSVPVEKGATVYGAKYITSLRAHPIEVATYEGDALKIRWGTSSNDQFLESELVYLNKEGVEQTETILLEIGDRETIIEDIMYGQAPKYRSAFLPDTSSIDVFYSPFVNMPVETLFKRLQTGRYSVIEVLPIVSQPGGFEAIYSRFKQALYDHVYSNSAQRSIQYIRIREKSENEITVHFRYVGATGGGSDAYHDYRIIFDDNVIRFEDIPDQTGAGYSTYYNILASVVVEFDEYMLNNTFEVDFYSPDPGVVPAQVRFKPQSDPDNFMLASIE